MSSEVMKRAWHIRRVSARRLGCGVMEVLWGECLAWARKVIKVERMHATKRVVWETRVDQAKVGMVTRMVRRLQGWKF